MSTAIWNASAGTPTATHRIPVDTSGAGTPTMYTVQQVADLETSVGTSVNALGSIAVNTAIDLALGGFVSATIGANLTLSFTNPPAGGTEFTLVLTNGGAFTVTWPGTVSWAGATAPTLMASGTDVLRFTSGNGGTNWYGWHERDEVTIPGGSSTQLQYNNAGAFGGMSGTAWDDTNRAETRTGATVTTSNPVQSLTQTWNAGAVSFTGWKLNVTNTASAAASLVSDWQVNGTSLLNLRSDGRLYVKSILIDGGGTGTASLDVSGLPNALRTTTLNIIGAINFGNGYATLSSGNNAGITIAHLAASTGGIILSPGGSDYVEQRRGTNAQASRIYGTYTDASNFVRASLAATSTAVTLSAQTAGTGADDVPVIITPAGTSQVEVGNGVQFTEMTAPSAPAANKVILFAQDNGAGKTQLMALFPSGAAQQVAIEP